MKQDDAAIGRREDEIFERFRKRRDDQGLEIEVGLEGMPDTSGLDERLAEEITEIAWDFRALSTIDFALKYKIPPRGAKVERYVGTHEEGRVHPWSDTEAAEAEEFARRIFEGPIRDDSGSTEV